MARFVIYTFAVLLTAIFSAPYALIGPAIIPIIPVIFMSGVGMMHIADDVATFVENRQVAPAVNHARPSAYPSVSPS